jgi:dihydropyrimidinase
VTDLVIRNGTVVREDGVDRMDVAVTGGRISAIGRGLSGARTIDADGLIVLPGGVDNHCHIEQPVSKNGASADTFATATASAAIGGTTSIVCFARQAEGETLADLVEDALGDDGPDRIRSSCGGRLCPADRKDCPNRRPLATKAA